MTKKLGISLPDELHEWATREVEEGRAESVSALVAEGLRVLRSDSLLAELVADLRAELGPQTEEDKAWLEEAMRAAEEAQRRFRAQQGESAAAGEAGGAAGDAA